MQKVKIIQSIDHQLSLDDIARAEGLDFDELIDKLDDIVDSGTKLNIDYYLDDTYDEDQIDDIYDYFMESDTDDIDKAMDELNEDYTEEEIRLVRIQLYPRWPIRPTASHYSTHHLPSWGLPLDEVSPHFFFFSVETIISQPLSASRASDATSADDGSHATPPCPHAAKRGYA